MIKIASIFAIIGSNNRKVTENNSVENVLNPGFSIAEQSRDILYKLAEQI